LWPAFTVAHALHPLHQEEQRVPGAAQICAASSASDVFMWIRICEAAGCSASDVAVHRSMPAMTPAMTKEQTLFNLLALLSIRCF